MFWNVLIPQFIFLILNHFLFPGQEESQQAFSFVSDQSTFANWTRVGHLIQTGLFRILYKK